MWKDGKRAGISWDEIIAFLSEDTELHSVIVGTDSQPYSGGDCVVTVVCVLSESRKHHARYFYYTHERVPSQNQADNGALFRRLYDEALKSVETANTLKAQIPDLTVSVHLDVQQGDGITRSSRFAHSLTSLARGYGYDVETKPDAWVASSIADRLTKRPPRRRRS